MALWYHKIHSLQWLNGSIREDLTPDERSVWADLLALAGISRESRRGFIERSEGIPYSRQHILTVLNIGGELYDRAVGKCVEEGRLVVYEDGTMQIINWDHYNDTTNYSEEKQKAKASAAKAQVTKRKNEALMSSISSLYNRLLCRLDDGRVRYAITEDGQLVDKATGVVMTVDKLSEMVDGDK